MTKFYNTFLCLVVLFVLSEARRSGFASPPPPPMSTPSENFQTGSHQPVWRDGSFSVPSSKPMAPLVEHYPTWTPPTIKYEVPPIYSVGFVPGMVQGFVPGFVDHLRRF